MKYPYRFQPQEVPLLELCISILMLGSFLNDLLIVLIYEIEIDILDQSQILYASLFTILLSIHLKESRLTTYPLVIGHLLLLASKYYSHQDYIILTLALILQIGYFALIIVMPKYKYPKMTGKYMVGFTEFILNGKQVSIYYPTEVKSKINFIYSCRDRDYVKNIYTDFQHVLKWRPPLVFIRLMLQFMNKLKVEELQVESPVLKGQWPAVLFSNGLGGLKDHYSCFHKEFASNGYIVYAIQQDEQTIILDDDEIHDYKTGKATLENELGQKMLDKIKVIRHEQLNDRVQRFIGLIDYVYQQKNIDFNKVFVAGHSFGATTVFRTAQLDQKRIAGVLVYDPWFLPFKMTDLEKEVNRPILCVNSETFRHRKENETIERNQKVFDAQKEKLVVMIKGAQHLCCTDLLFKMPFEMLLFAKLDKLDKILEITVAHLRLSLFFLNSLSCKKTLAKFEEFSKENFKEQIHVVEYDKK